MLGTESLSKASYPQCSRRLNVGYIVSKTFSKTLPKSSPKLPPKDGKVLQKIRKKDS